VDTFDLIYPAVWISEHDAKTKIAHRFKSEPDPPRAYTGDGSDWVLIAIDCGVITEALVARHNGALEHVDQKWLRIHAGYLDAGCTPDGEVIYFRKRQVAAAAGEQAAEPVAAPSNEPRALVKAIMLQDPHNKARWTKKRLKKHVEKVCGSKVANRTFEQIRAACIEETGAVAYKKTGPRGEMRPIRGANSK
jgi:hypothetical protein